MAVLKEVEFDEQQDCAIQAINDMAKGFSKDKVIILTGQAGTGKSTIVSHLRKNKSLYYLCATTGRAALLIGCGTVDSVFEFRRPTKKSKVYTKRNMAALKARMFKCADTIVIDEASMIGYGMAEEIYHTATVYGKRLVLVGDWAQAAPVNDPWPFDHELFRQARVIKLEKSYRHTDSDSAYLKALNKIREGSVDEETAELMTARVAPIPNDDHVVKIYAINSKVASHNADKLEEHCAKTSEPKFRLAVSVEDMRSMTAKQRHPMSEAQRIHMITHSRLSHCEHLALGARVMILRNIWESARNNSYELVASNGDTGVLIDVGILDDELGTIYLDNLSRDGETWADVEEVSARGGVFAAYADILLDRTKEVIRVNSINVTDGEEDNPKFTLSGIPIVLAYAITVHKVQGATLNKAWVDMRSIGYMKTKESQHGLAYVALSRTRRLEDLTISNWSPEVIHCDPAVNEFVTKKGDIGENSKV